MASCAKRACAVCVSGSSIRCLHQGTWEKKKQYCFWETESPFKHSPAIVLSSMKEECRNLNEKFWKVVDFLNREWLWRGLHEKALGFMRRKSAPYLVVISWISRGTHKIWLFCRMLTLWTMLCWWTVFAWTLESFRRLWRIIWIEFRQKIIFSCLMMISFCLSDAGESGIHGSDPSSVSLSFKTTYGMLKLVLSSTLTVVRCPETKWAIVYLSFNGLMIEITL